MSLFNRTNVFRAVTLGALVLAVPAGLAFARGPHEGGPHEGGPHQCGQEGHGRFHGAGSADDVRERMGMVAERALSHVDATPEQRTQIDAILDEGAPRAFEARSEMHALRQELRAEFTKPQLDEAKIEKLRQKGLTLADDKSRALTDTLVQVAEVLTPEQRVILGDAMAQRAAQFDSDEE